VPTITRSTHASVDPGIAHLTAKLRAFIQLDERHLQLVSTNRLRGSINSAEYRAYTRRRGAQGDFVTR